MKNCVTIFLLLFVGCDYCSVPEIANFNNNELLKLGNVRVGKPAFSRWGDVYILSYVANRSKKSCESMDLDSDILDFQHESIDVENNSESIKVIHFKSGFEKATQKKVANKSKNSSMNVPKLLDGHQTFPAQCMAAFFGILCHNSNNNFSQGTQLKIKGNLYSVSHVSHNGLSSTVLFDPIAEKELQRVKGYTFSRGFFWDESRSCSYLPKKITVQTDVWAGAESFAETYSLVVDKKDIQNDSPAECVKIRNPHWRRIAGAFAAVGVAAAGIWTYAKR